MGWRARPLPVPYRPTEAYMAGEFSCDWLKAFSENARSAMQKSPALNTTIVQKNCLAVFNSFCINPSYPPTVSKTSAKILMAKSGFF